MVLVARELGVNWSSKCNPCVVPRIPPMLPERSPNFRIESTDLPPEAVLFGSTPAMQDIRARLERVIPSDLPVLIMGESGSGKEVIAKYLHSRSPRHQAAFVRVNCAAIPAALLESELFGYEKGSVTGAKESKKGLVEIAEGGTLFLDEIGDMHPELQGKLLHLLDDGAYTRIGATTQMQGNIRVICATNANLTVAVEGGTFRQDLLHRIDAVCVTLPALRERRSDIPQLCEYFLGRLGRQFGRAAPLLNPATLQLLQEWTWPGNMRELENWIARAIILGDDLTLSAELRHQVVKNSPLKTHGRRSSPLKEASRKATESVTNSLIIKALQDNQWNRRKTAEELNMSYRSLLYKLREVGVPQRRKGHRSFPPTQ